MAISRMQTNSFWRQQEGPCHGLLPRVPGALTLPDLAEEARQRRDTNFEMEDCAK